MASLMETILGQLGGGELKQLSQKLGADEQTTGTASSAAVATLLGALAKNTSNSSGAEALSSALEKDHDGNILSDLGGLISNPQIGNGDGILKHLLGGRRATVEQGLSKTTGMDSGAVGQLLTTLAPVVLGALGKTRKEQGVDASGLASLLGQERQNLERQQPQAKGLLSALLDSDGDGDVDISDIAKKGAGLLGKFLGK